MTQDGMVYDSIDGSLENFSHIRLATADDNEEILKFYNNESMEAGGESISFDRNPNFFSFYELTTKQYWVFLFLNKDQTIGGIASMLRHVRKVEGKDVPLAYLCDLRISSNASRITKLQWRKFFPDTLKLLTNLAEHERCETAYTAVLASNTAAVNSLTKSGRGMTYRKLGGYNIHSFVNTGFLKSKKYITKTISQEDFLGFYNLEGRSSFLSEDPSYVLDKLIESSSETEYLGVYRGQELIAVTKPILENKSRRIKIQNMNKAKRVATSLFKLFSRPQMNNKGEIETLDLSYWTCKKSLAAQDTGKVIESVQRWIDDSGLLKKVHIINIIESNNKVKNSFVKRGISFTTKGLLFEVHPESEAGILPMDEFRFEGAFL